MISPIRNQRPPYKLPSNIIYFHDWRYVHHGSHSTGWRDAEGQWLRIWTNDERPPPDTRTELHAHRHPLTRQTSD